MISMMVRKSRKLRAYGSVMDVLPLGDYSELMPQGRQSDRIAKYWISTGQYVGKAIGQYEQKAERRASEQNLATA